MAGSPPRDDSLRDAIEAAFHQSGLVATNTQQVEPAIGKSVEQVLADLMAPYAKKVFRFVVWYCAVVGAIIIGDGFGDGIFHLSDTVLGIIAGSTAVSVIGLIGVVVRGLFGARKA